MQNIDNEKSPLPFLMTTALVASLFLCLVFAALFCVFHLGWMESCAITFGTVVYHFLIRFASPVILSAVFRKKYHYNSWWFRQKRWEPDLYAFLKVKQWKGHIVAYDPSEFSFKKHTVEEIVINMCHAEATHELIIVLGFLSLLFSIRLGGFIAFLLTAILAGCVDSVFVIIQRYNRPRMIKFLNQTRR